MVTVQIYGTDTYLEVLDPNITYIKTAGDLGELTMANSSYSWSMKFPKTPNNTKILDGLGTVGSGSRKPYEKIYVNLLENGYPIVTKGLLNIRETNDDYSIYIQEGFIDFIKDIKTDTIGDKLDLSDLDHIRNFPNIRDSLDMSLNYTYLIADVNGAYYPNQLDTTNLNSVYMSPYANIKYIFDKIFETYGWTYTVNSAVESSIDNAWMSYPSEIVLDSSGGSIVTDTSVATIDAIFLTYYESGNALFRIPTNVNSIDSDFIISLGNGEFLVMETGDYEFQYASTGSLTFTDQYGIVSNGMYENIIIVNGVVYDRTLISFNYLGETKIFQKKLFAGDVVSFGVVSDETGLELYDVDVTINSQFGTINYISASAEISFTKALIKLKVVDFIKEIMVRESLTAFVDSENRVIEFLTLEERISADSVDWSDKYVKRKKESYLYQDYARANLIKHKYDDDISDYNDGVLVINNENLDTEKEMYQSFTQSPGEELSVFVDSNVSYSVPMLKMFEVEVKEDQATGDLIGKYKFLKDRFFIVRANPVTKNIYIDDNLVTGYPMASLNTILLKDIVNSKYNTFDNISGDAKVHDIDLALSTSDIHALDLKKIYYFEQEAAYYILNRLSYKTGKTTTGNFLKITPN